MWNHAEVVALLDEQGVVRAISRNEEEAPIRDAIGNRIIENRVLESCKESAREAFEAALKGEEVQLVLGAIADDGHVFWSKVRLMPSPAPEIAVLMHARRLPRSWNELSSREKEVIHTLHEAQLNPKRAAKQLGITLNTLKIHFFLTA
jgi:DNA-directed RNA polymerase specialized sigma24 family protein